MGIDNRHNHLVRVEAADGREILHTNTLGDVSGRCGRQRDELDATISTGKALASCHMCAHQLTHICQYSTSFHVEWFACIPIARLHIGHRPQLAEQLLSGIRDRDAVGAVRRAARCRPLNGLLPARVVEICAICWAHEWRALWSATTELHSVEMLRPRITAKKIY